MRIRTFVPPTRYPSPCVASPAARVLSAAVLAVIAAHAPAQQQFEELRKRHLPADSDNTTCVAVGDVDGDGDLDLVCGNTGLGGGQNRLYVNNGSGVFADATATQLPVGSDATASVALGDVDGDGDLDAYVVVWNGERRLLRNESPRRRWLAVRLVRAEFLTLKEREFVVWSQSIGASTLRIIWRHILPNAMAPVLVAMTLGIPAAILTESSLSFLGLGVQPPRATWGNILNEGKDAIELAWWLSVYPGVAILVTVLAYNLLGEGIRDALDPRLRQSGGRVVSRGS